jgi:hypothetical protein
LLKAKHDLRQAFGTKMAHIRRRIKQQRPSLFIISLPRSLSSDLYRVARQSLDFQEPRWTSDGEILNVDRFAFLPRTLEDSGLKFVRRRRQRDSFRRAIEFLNQVVQPREFVYKDVIQPFVMAEWLQERRFPTIRIKRNVADVAQAMLRHRWLYPARLFAKSKNLEQAMVRGLLKAEHALDSISAEVLDFDAIIMDEESLYRALVALYGKKQVRFIKYIDDQFRAKRDEVLSRRRTESYRAIADFVRKATRS